jgi:hypothetical protein
VESLLITLVIIVAILIVVVLLLPDRLERRAHENQQQRRDMAEELAAISADTAALAATLEPYRALGSAAYVAPVGAIAQQLSALGTEQAAMARQIAALRLPDIPRLPLPVQHFLLAPNDATAVFSDGRRLAQMARAVRAEGAELAAVRDALAELDAVPTRLRADSKALLRRLDAITAALRVEGRAGVGALEELETGLATLATTVNDLERRFHARTPLPELDDAARRLEAATASTAALETQVGELNRARLALDRRLQETAGELDDIQVMAKGGAATTPVSRPSRAALLQAAALLNEKAPEARRLRDFAAAEDHVTAAHQLIGLARNLTESEKQLAYLEAHDAGLGYGPDIAAARRELAGVLLRLSPAAAAPEGMAALAASDDLPELAARTADLHHELSNLVLRQREAVAQLERDAVADRDRLVAAWESSQQLLPLSNADPLVGRYQRVLAQFTAARGDPGALQAARKDAATFLATQREWAERLATQRTWQTQFRAEMPRLVDSAIAEAGDWACLGTHVAAIQQRVADFAQVQAGFNKARTSGEALAIMDQFERLESDIRREYAQLADQAARLNWLADDLTKTLALVASGDEEAFSPRHARTQQMIDHRVAQAHAAMRCEDAVQAMLWAAEMAQNLGT